MGALIRSRLAGGGALLLGVAITIAIVSGGSAQNNKTPAMDEAFLLATRPVPDFTADFRAKFVQSLTSYCQEVLNALPTNTPAEDDWVASEQRTGNGAKIQRLLNSKEYGRSMLKTTFSDCKDTATTLSELIQQFPRKTESSELFARLEAREFVKLAMNFDAFLEPYSSKLDLNKNMKFALGDTYIHVIRFGLLKAAREALQDVP
jgi:hypothetical protein